MSGYYLCNPVFGLDKSGWDLVADELEMELGRTCLPKGPDMSENSFSNSVRNPDMPGFMGTLICG
jgi:hypothetical protein